MKSIKNMPFFFLDLLKYALTLIFYQNASPSICFSVITFYFKFLFLYIILIGHLQILKSTHLGENEFRYLLDVSIIAMYILGGNELGHKTLRENVITSRSQRQLVDHELSLFE